MGRVKGSKNKKREAPKEVEKEEVKPRRLQGHPIAEVSQAKEWKPEPKIDAEPPVDADELCQRQLTPYVKCYHKKATHYGGQKGHCNTSGCSCLEFQ